MGQFAADMGDGFGGKALDRMREDHREDMVDQAKPGVFRQVIAIVTSEAVRPEARRASIAPGIPPPTA